jgi:hypothetical protein
LESTSASTSYRETYDLEAGSTPRLVIRGGVGDVTIRAGSDLAVIAVEYTKTAYSISGQSAKNELDDMRVTTDHEGDTLQINTAQPLNDSSLRANRVDLAITVPESITLDIHMGGGDLQITGVRAVGALKARAMAGGAVIEDVIAPDGMDIQANAGGLTFVGTIGSEGTYTLTATVGPLTVRLPAETDARLDAQSLFGAIAVEGFDLVDASEQQLGAGASLRGVMGQGGPPLTLKNQMGEIRVAAE